jgi:pimeloyl-ACP methyl ester carboxylesterase
MPRELDLPPGRIRAFEAGSGAPIVFVHGGFVNANVWRKVVPRLAPDFHCVTLDLPLGSHDLPMNQDADLSLDGLVDLVDDAIEVLSLDDVTLVGMDTGGAICQCVVTERPEGIGRLVLTSCDYRDNFPPRLFWHLKLLPALSPAVPLLFAPLRLRAPRRLPNVFGWLSKDQVDRAAEDSWILPGLEDGRVRADANKMIRGVFDKRRLNEAADRLPTFERPALIAWSSEDRIFPTEHGEKLARELPNARLEWIHGSRTLSMEDQPERLSELIAAFVREPERTPV